MDRFLHVRPRTIVMIALAYLAIAWMLIAVIDVYDVAGLRATLGRDEGAPVWVHLFGEAGVTEMLQWLTLAGLALAGAFFAGRAGEDHDGKPARFLALLAVLGALMLIEDAGNPSHRLGVYAEDVLGTTSSYVRMVARLPVFLVMGGIAVYAFGRYWPSVARHRPGGKLLLGGLVAYGVAAISSVPANAAFDFYARAGVWLTVEVLGDRLMLIEPFGPLEAEVSARVFTGVMFMDLVYEESVELVAAVLLLAGVLALGRSYLAERLPQPAVVNRD